jgi:hypothetical protein
VRRVAAAFGFALFCFYAITGTGHTSLSDGYVIFLTSRSLLDRGDFAIRPDFLGNARRGTDGEYYSKYGPALAFAHLPMIAAGRLLVPFHPEIGGAPVDAVRRDEFFAQLTNAWVMAAAMTLLLLIGIELGFSPLSATVVAVATAVASPSWLYARIDSTEALQAFSLIGALYFLGRPPQRLRWDSLGGAMLGIAVLTKAANLLLVPWFALYVLAAPERSHDRSERLAALLAPILVASALYGWHDYARFGDILNTGYDLRRETFSQSVPIGATRLLFAPSFGLLFFWPAASLLPFGFRQLALGRRPEVVLIAGVLLTLLFFYGGWWAYSGAQWGPRFLVPAIPLLALGLLPLAATRAGWRLLAVAMVVGLGAQAIAVGTSYWSQVLLVNRDLPEQSRRHRPVNHPRVAPLRVGAWWWALLVDRELEGPEQVVRRVKQPPWAGQYPWRDAEAAARDIVPRIGLDLWAAPARWRMAVYSRIWPGESTYRVPTSGALRWALLAGMVTALVTLAAALCSLARDRASAVVSPSSIR